MGVHVDAKDYGRLSDIVTRRGWQIYGGRASIDMCKKFPELNDVAWMSIDLERVQGGMPLKRVLQQSIDEFHAVWGACRVAVSKETSIKGMSEADAVAKLYEYINAMIDVKAEMNEILKEIYESKIRLIK